MRKWYKECPFCANEIMKKAIKCQYCGEFLDTNEPQTKNYEYKNNNRMRRWIFFRNMMILFWVEIIVCFLFALMGATEDALYWLSFIVSLISLCSFIIPRTIKRCHDIWWSWRWTILFVLPIICVGMYFIPWTDWDNKYWPKPD